jgi:hypothetical protein
VPSIGVEEEPFGRGVTLNTDLDTLLTALYVALTDHIIPSRKVRPDAPGGPAAVTDAELVTLAVAQAHLGFTSERRWLRAAPKLVGHLFPRLLSQSEYNRRLRHLAPLMDAALRHLAADTPSSFDTVRLLDGTKIICGMSRETVKRSDLFGWCGYGYDASHSLYYWGAKLMLLTAPDGLVTGFILVNPKMFGEAAATSMMLELPANVPPAGTTIVADKGLRSRALEAELAEHSLVLIRPAYANEPDPGIYPAWLRQRIESVNQSLKHPLGIEQPGAHRPDGLFTRIVQRLLALNAAIWHNWQTGANQKRSLISYGH